MKARSFFALEKACLDLVCCICKIRFARLGIKQLQNRCEIFIKLRTVWGAGLDSVRLHAYYVITWNDESASSYRELLRFRLGQSRARIKFEYILRHIIYNYDIYCAILFNILLYLYTVLFISNKWYIYYILLWEHFLECIQIYIVHFDVTLWIEQIFWELDPVPSHIRSSDVTLMNNKTVIITMLNRI